MPRPKPRLARREEVSITRKGTNAVIAFHDGSAGGMHLEIGESIARMSDDEILQTYNSVVRSMQELAASYTHVPVEVPLGSPQIRYFAEGHQWVPRGAVLRCYIDDGGPDGEARIEIDDRTLSLRDFGRLLTTYAGWGMRIIFVPDDETHLTHPIAVKEPDDA